LATRRPEVFKRGLRSGWVMKLNYLDYSKGKLIEYIEDCLKLLTKHYKDFTAASKKEFYGDYSIDGSISKHIHVLTS